VHFSKAGKGFGASVPTTIGIKNSFVLCFICFLCLILTCTNLLAGITDAQDKEDILRASYCGLQYHVKSHEAYGTDFKNIDYVPLEKLLEEINSDFPEASAGMNN